jgi:predicted kinase
MRVPTFQEHLLESKGPKKLKPTELSKLMKNEKVYVLLGGTPAAGKSWVIDKLLKGAFPVLDVDQYILKFGTDEYEDRKKNGMKARVLINKDTANFLATGTSFVKQGVSARFKAVEAQAQKAKAAGFITVFFYVETDVETALKRNKERVERGERATEVPLYVIERKRKDSLGVLNLVKKTPIFDYVIVYKN